MLCSCDVTKDILEENAIEVTVGDGWYAGRLGYTSRRAIFGAQTRLYAQIILQYADGSTETIETDDKWKVYETEIQYADFFNGECVDENKRIDAFALYDTLKKAQIVDEKREFKAYDMEPVVCIDTISPQIIRKKETLLLDFGQNFAGVINFTAKGRKGVKIVVRHAEMLAMDNFTPTNGTPLILMGIYRKKNDLVRVMYLYAIYYELTKTGNRTF